MHNRSRSSFGASIAARTLACALAVGGGAALADEIGDYGPAPRAEQLTGRVVPSKDVELTTPLAGLLQAVHVKRGDRVAPGAAIAQMDDALQRVAAESARLRAERQADRREAQAVLRQAERELARARGLYERDAASEWEVLRRESELERAEAALAGVEEALALAAVEHEMERLRLDRHRIEAPFAGVIVQRLAEAGAGMAANDGVVRLVALDPLHAELNLPVTLYHRLEPGRSYRLAGDAPVEAELRGRLKVIEPMVDLATGTFRAVFEIGNPDLALPAGFRVSLHWPPTPLEEPAEREDRDGVAASEPGGVAEDR